MSKVKEAIICAGFGGQGVMVLGKFLANAGMMKGMYVTCMPSYGVEVRGGTAHSAVRIGSEMIADPVIVTPGTAIVMNGPSLDKFESRIASGGLLILNTSLCEHKPERGDIEVIAVPLSDEAIKLGNVKVANIVAAGIYSAKKKIFDRETLKDVVVEMAGGREELVPINIKAVDRGFDIVDQL